MLLMAIIMALPVLGIGFFFVLPLPVALPAYLAAVALSAFYHWLMMKAIKEPVKTGRRGMVGLQAEVLEWQGESGQVRCRGEIWQAQVQNGARLSPGDKVEVVGVSGMFLVVRPRPDVRVGGFRETEIDALP
jgi:membrane-bound ClpP family serine protease